MVFSLDYRAHSEIGLVRKNNQDSGFVSPHMIVVADGMGGAAAGDLASTVAIQQVSKADAHHTAEDAHEVLAGAVARANDTLADLVDADPALDGMGTTVTGAMFTGAELAMVHIGDSRAYLWRAGRLTRLTHDHSWVQSLVDEGKITPDEAAVHPHRSLLLKVLNGQATHEPDLDLIPLALDDRLLFCSDGLCGFVHEAEIARIIDGTTLDDAVRLLTEAAHRGGGADNITVLLADVLPHSEALDAAEPLMVGAASERTIPVVEHHTLSGAEGIVLDPEPTATGERVVDEELDEEALRYAPRSGGHRAALWSLALVSCLALVAGGALWGGWRYSQGQFYVGENDAQVAIFQGIPGEVLGRPLSKVVEQQRTPLSDLPRYYQQQVRATIPVRDVAAGRVTAAELAVRAEQCVAKRQQATRPTPSMTTPTAITGSQGPSSGATGARPGASSTSSAAASSAAPSSTAATATSSATPDQAVTQDPTNDQEC